jgi:hypothetical protein
VDVRLRSVIRWNLRRSEREARRNARGSYAKDVRTLLPSFRRESVKFPRSTRSAADRTLHVRGKRESESAVIARDRTGVHGLTAGGNGVQPGRGGSVLRRLCRRMRCATYGEGDERYPWQRVGGSGPQLPRTEVHVRWTAQVARSCRDVTRTRKKSQDTTRHAAPSAKTAPPRPVHLSTADRLSFFSLKGGWWTRPANWRTNTFICITGIALATAGVWKISARNEVRHARPTKEIPSAMVRPTGVRSEGVGLMLCGTVVGACAGDWGEEGIGVVRRGDCTDP